MRPPRGCLGSRSRHLRDMSSDFELSGLSVTEMIDSDGIPEQRHSGHTVELGQIRVVGENYANSQELRTEDYSDFAASLVFSCMKWLGTAMDGTVVEDEVVAVPESCFKCGIDKDGLYLVA